MKTLVTCILLFIGTMQIKAQSRNAFPYQAVLRDSLSRIISNQAVSIRFSILDSGSTSTIVYQEIQSTTTNVLGLINLNIGQGSVTAGSFNSINWASGSKYLKLELDVNGGSNYTLFGNTQLLSVPYALHANSSTTTNGGHYIGEQYGGGIVFYVYDNGQHGLIAATSDLRGIVGGLYDSLLYWSYTGPTPTPGGILGGYKNTIAMYPHSGNNSDPVRECFRYINPTGIMFGDWYLPSIDELRLLYSQRAVVGGFHYDPIPGNGYYGYYSSTYSGNGEGPYEIRFTTGEEGTAATVFGATPYGRARPIRKF